MRAVALSSERLADADEAIHIERQRSHPSLVAMLVLTQLAVGAFLVGQLTRALDSRTALTALALGVAAMGAGLRHVVRRRTPWMRREILGFSIFAALATLDVASFFWAPLSRWQPDLALLVIGSGLVAVGGSVMVYAATRRPSWHAPSVAWKFFGTTLVLGTATTLLISSFGDGGALRTLCQLLAVATAAKLAGELAVFRHLRRREHTPLRRSAMLMAGDLGGVSGCRFALGALGGMLLPSMMRAADGGTHAFFVASGVVIFLFCLAGELCERYLFFTAAALSRVASSASPPLRRARRT